jgi:hypothetical protein
VFQFA